jgi:hypothetical protein
MAFWLLFCLPGMVGATMFAPTTLPEKVARATHIVLGTVREIEAGDRPGDFVVTDVHLTVNRVIKGIYPGESLILEIPGGRTATRTMVVPGMPQFQVGQEALFMLIAVEGHYTFVPFGIYPVTSPTTLGISPAEVDQLLWEPTLPAGALPPLVPGTGGGGAVTIPGVLPSNPPPAGQVAASDAIPHGGGAPPQKAKLRRSPDPAVPLFLPEGQIALEGFLQLLDQE